MKKLLLLFAVMLSTVGAWAQNLWTLKSPVTTITTGKYVLVGMCSHGTGPCYYNSAEGGNRLYRLDKSKSEVTTGSLIESSYVWDVELLSDGKITVKWADDNSKFFIKDSGKNKNFQGTDMAQLISEIHTIDGKDYIALTLEDTNIGYIHANNPGGNPNLSYWNAYGDDGTAVKFTFYPVEQAATVAVTYSYKFDGVIKASEEVEAPIGGSFPAGSALPDYVAAVWPEGTVDVTDAGKTFEVECNSALPFEVSENFATAKWYYMNIRSDNKKWVAHSDNPPYSNRKERYPDIYGQWAFIGNPFDGIQVLNRGAGAGKTLGYDGLATESNIHMKDGATTWNITEGNGGFALHMGAGTNRYIHDYNSKLQIWDASGARTDAGSAFQVEAVEEFKFHQIWGNHYPWTTEVLTEAEVPAGVVDCQYHDDGLANIRMAQTKIIAKGGDVTVLFQYSSGSHMLMIVGVDIVQQDGTVVKSDYHEGKAGGSSSNNTYTLLDVAAGEYTLRYFVCQKTSGTEGLHYLTETNGNITVDGAKRANVDVKYVFTIDGVEKVQSEPVSCVPGDVYPDITNEFPYGIYVSKPSGTIVDSDIVNGLVTKTIQMEERLPFYKSTSLEEATWYVVDMHSNEARYVWTYVPDATTPQHNVQLPIEGVQTGLFGNEKYWCFIGNAYDGFKIYNKAAGENLTLNKPEDGNTSAWMSDAASATSYGLVPTTTGITGAFCFQPKDHSYYLNTQKPDGVSVKILQGWHDTDEGSSCRFFAPTDFIEEAILANYNPEAPLGAVGTKTVLKGNTVRDVIANTLSAIQADGWNADVITPEVSEAIGSLIESDKVEMAAGYYFIKGTGTGNNANWYVTYEGVDCKAVALANGEKLGAKHVWSIEAVDGEDGKYKFKSSNLDKYLTIAAAPTVSKITSIYNDGYAFKFNETSSIAHWIIKDGNNYTMRTESDGRINEWHTGEDDESWYIIPATELDITISNAGWATTCLPFDVVLPEELTAYALTGVDDVNGDETGTVSLISKAGIPAKQGALLNGAPGTYTLSIEETASNWEANMLSGTTVATDMSTLTGDVYLLTADGENSAKLSKLVLANDATEAQKTLAANKAYLNIGTSSARFLVFNFDDGTETAIESIEAENAADVVVYDLAGRRVQKAQKGLYIVNGKKVIK